MRICDFTIIIFIIVIIAITITMNMYYKPPVTSELARHDSASACFINVYIYKTFRSQVLVSSYNGPQKNILLGITKVQIAPELSWDFVHIGDIATSAAAVRPGGSFRSGL